MCLNTLPEVNDHVTQSNDLLQQMRKEASRLKQTISDQEEIHATLVALQNLYIKHHRRDNPDDKEG